MNIRCHGCGRAFRVRQERLPAGGARTRCPRCHALLVIPPAGEADHETGPEGAGRKGETDLFAIPPADLILEQEDLFGLGGPRGEAEAIHDRPRQVAQAGTGGPPPPPPEARSAAPPASRRRPGFRGWLARLFGGAS